MISKKFYVQLIVRVLFLTIAAHLLAFCWFSDYTYLVLPIGAMIIIQMLGFITYFNQTNRQIAHLFESIKNEDFSFQFPEQTKLSSFKKLNQSLNQVNQQIRDQQIQIAAQERYYQEILETATLGIFTVNPKGHILYANPTVRKLLNLEQMNHIRQFKETAPNLYAAVNSYTPLHHQLVQITNEREQIQLLVNAAQVMLNEEAILLIIIQNIKAELDQKETESWSKLIRVMTHEIMNTIAPITSVSESLLKHYFSPQDAVQETSLEKDQLQKIFQGLQIIKEQSQSLTTFVQSYRSLLNIPKPNKQLVKAIGTIEKVQLLMEAELQTNQIELQVLNTDQQFEIFADEQQITQVLINLIKNAIQALQGQEKGQITLNYGEHAKGQKFIEISDNGPGISPEAKDQIFIPFFTTKRNGTGTGLSLVKQIMLLHGGRVELHSNLDNGATFMLWF
ncbi:MAG: ATP-binding protein [Bacteroidota bacterium]